LSHFDVVVVGAGGAGIAATRRLVKAGRSVRLLEARLRAGGRACTDSSLGSPADMGAGWLHFAKENAWTTVAEQQGRTVIRREPNWGPGSYIGARAPDELERRGAAASYARYEKLVDEATATGLDVSLASILPRDDFRTRYDAIMTWAVGVETAQVSSLDLARYADSTNNWVVAEGLGSVVARAAEDLPLTLGCTVRVIDWSGDAVLLKTSLGDLSADTVIVAIPTAVLAAGGIRFDPPLPREYREAIESLPLGVANKVFFDVPEGLLPFADTTNMIGHGNTSRTASYIVRPSGLPLIAAYFGGDLARELEMNGGLAEFAREEMRAMFGAELVAAIRGCVASSWAKDPLSLGSYSAALPGHARCREVLGEPVSPQLAFAGEACSVSHYGTLHGAWMSAYKATDRLVGGTN
jgi:monoamine oxidase